MFWVRLRSSVILMVITISTILLGGNVLFTTIMAISLIGLYELYKTVGLERSFIGIIAYIGGILYQLLILWKQESFVLPLLFSFILILLIVYVITFPRYQTEHITMIFFGLFYVTVMLSFVYKVRMLSDGAILVWLIFIGAWGSDTSAYCVGMLFGKHKFLPKLSPKKSLEGCIGGVIGAALLGLLYGTIFKNNIVSAGNPGLEYALIGGSASILSQIGDLAASAIKRDHNIKDYGNLIPGHGGILDRFDSILFVAPMVYYLTVLL